MFTCSSAAGRALTRKTRREKRSRDRVATDTCNDARFTFECRSLLSYKAVIQPLKNDYRETTEVKSVKTKPGESGVPFVCGNSGNRKIGFGSGLKLSLGSYS